MVRPSFRLMASALNAACLFGGLKQRRRIHREVLAQLVSRPLVPAKAEEVEIAAVATVPESLRARDEDLRKRISDV